MSWYSVVWIKLWCALYTYITQGSNWTSVSVSLYSSVVRAHLNWDLVRVIISNPIESYVIFSVPHSCHQNMPSFATIFNFNAHDSMKKSCETEKENFTSSDIGKRSLTHWLLFSEFHSSWDCLCDVSHASVAFLIPFPGCCRSTPINRWKYLHKWNYKAEMSVNWLFYWMTDWWMDGWTDLLTQQLTDWLPHWLTDRLTDWQENDWVTDSKLINRPLTKTVW